MKSKMFLPLAAAALMSVGPAFVLQAEAQTPRDTIAQTDELINVLPTSKGNKNALHKHVRNILRSLDRGNTAAACDQIDGTIEQLFDWIRGRKLTAGQATPVLDNLLEAEGDLNCPAPSPSPSPTASPTTTPSPTATASPAAR